MVARRTEAALQSVVGLGQSRDVVAVEEARCEARGHLAEVVHRSAQGTEGGLVRLHVVEHALIAEAHLRASELLRIAQDMRRTMHPGIGPRERGPERRSRLERLQQELLQLLESGWQAPFFSATRSMEAVLSLRRVCRVSPAASSGARPSSVRALRTARQ